MKVNWSKAKTAYITGGKSYREIAKQLKVAPSVVSKRGKEEGWVEARKAYRAELAQKSIEVCQELEINRLKSLQDSAMKMCERLEKAINDENELYMHAGVESTGKGMTRITEKRLSSIDAQKVRNLCQSLQTMTNTMRNLFEIQTRAEKERAERERSDNGDTTYVLEYAEGAEKYSK